MATELNFESDDMCLVADCKNNLLIGGYESGFLAFWDLRQSNKPSITTNCFQDKSDVTSVIFGTSNNNIVYCAAGKVVYSIDIRKLKDESWNEKLFECEDDVNQVVLSENEKILAAADDYGDVTLFDFNIYGSVTSLDKHTNSVSCLKFCRGKPRYLISGGYDSYLVQWDAVKPRYSGRVNVENLKDPEWVLPEGFNPPYVLTCDVDDIETEFGHGDICVAGTENGNLHLIRCEKKLNHIKTFRAHDQAVTQAKYYRDFNGKPFLFTGSNDATIKIWSMDCLTSEKVEPLQIIDHKNKVNWLSFYQQSLVICDTSSTITLKPIEI